MCPTCHQKNVQTIAAFLTVRVQVFLSWKHSGFNLHSGEPVPPENKAQLEKLAQYILRNPFSVQKMTMESPTDTIICRSRLNPKINRNFEAFTPSTDFLAVVTHSPHGRNVAGGIRLITKPSARSRRYEETTLAF